VRCDLNIGGCVVKEREGGMALFEKKILSENFAESHVKGKNKKRERECSAGSSVNMCLEFVKV
jgi:hypothetical protein